MKNSQKGFIGLFALIVVVALIVGGGYAYLQNKPSDVSIPANTTAQANRVFKFGDVLPMGADGSFPLRIGDVVGGMRVSAVSPFNESYSAIGPNNVKIQFTGPIEVTGKYEHLVSENGFSGYCMSDFGSATRALLPFIPMVSSAGSNQLPLIFCFRDNETDYEGNVAGKILGEKTGVITVTIDQYELRSYPSEVMDWATLSILQ